MENSGLFDILVLAMIAAFLIFRLRSALGRKVGRQRPTDRFPREVEDSGDAVIHLPERQADESRAPGADEPPPIKREDAAKPDDAAPGVTQLRIADPAFDEEKFIEGARLAFEMILLCFAAGDKRRLQALLSEKLLERFLGEFERRSKSDRSLDATLVSFVSSDIVAARVEDSLAAITVRFVTEQVHLWRDREGAVVEGDEKQVTRVTDTWTFERDLRSGDLNWLLVETRGGE